MGGLAGPTARAHRPGDPRARESEAPLPHPRRAPVLREARGINLEQLIASERSHQRLNKHNLTERMIIDLVKKEKRKIELECIFEAKLEFNIITLRDETDYNYHFRGGIFNCII